MLTLILMRHGQARLDRDEEDKQRALTNGGRVQAAEAALFIEAQVGIPSVVVCSDALRARQSADMLMDRFPKTSLVVESRLYDTYTTHELIDIVASAAGQSRCVAVVGHNPDISYRSSRLCKKPQNVGFPTAGVLVLSFSVDGWEDVSAGTAEIVGANFL